MAKFVGPEALHATDYIETDWSAEEWTRGAYASTFGIGGSRASARTCAARSARSTGRAADIAGFGHMHMEGGVRSGEAAAAAVLAL